MNIKWILTLLLILGVSSSFAQRVEEDCFSSYVGKGLKGSLSYMDFRTKELTDVPIELTIKREGDVYQFNYHFPSEPKSDYFEYVEISKNGKKINQDKVSEVSKKGTTFKTISKGKDNKKVAYFHNTYMLSDNGLLMKHEIQYKDSDDLITRNVFRFKID